MQKPGCFAFPLGEGRCRHIDEERDILHDAVDCRVDGESVSGCIQLSTRQQNWGNRGISLPRWPKILSRRILTVHAAQTWDHRKPPSAVMGPVSGTMTAKTGLNAVMGPKNGTITAVWTCDETGVQCVKRMLRQARLSIHLHGLVAKWFTTYSSHCPPIRAAKWKSWCWNYTRITWFSAHDWALEPLSFSSCLFAHSLYPIENRSP